MDQKKILMPIMEAGAGHKAPAAAVKDSLESLYPGRFRIEIVDFVKECGAVKEDRMVKDQWNSILARPWIGKIGYRLLELLRIYPHRYVNLFLPDFRTKSREYLKNYRPDIVFAPHFFCAAAVAMARDDLGLPFKVIGYDTDPFDGYTWWSVPMADWMVVASREARDKLARRAMPADKIRIIPFPVNNKFFRITRSREEIGREYGVDPSLKTILSSAGAMGIGKNTEFVREIVKRNIPFNVILVCGKNEAVKKEMDEFKKATPSRANLIPVGFASNMNELHLACDLTMGKAGASATFETLLMKKPVIFTDWAGYNEKPNLDFCVKRRLGWHAKNLRDFLDIAEKILTTDILSEYTRNIEALNLESGADQAARFVAAELGVN